MYEKWLETVLDLLFPETKHCPFCWQEVEGRSTGGLCPECAEKILNLDHRFPTCPRCGRFTAADKCPNCYDWPEKISKVISVVPYDGIFKEKIFEIKYNNKKELVSPLGYLMASKVKKHLPPKRDMIIIPIPLHPLREEERGYNQSTLLARVVMRELRIPLTEDVLVRQHYERSQTLLGRGERRKNIQNAFLVEDKSKIRGKNVLLVDDILTTGATMVEAAAALHSAGAEYIIGLTWAAGIDKHLLNLGNEISFI